MKAVREMIFIVTVTILATLFGSFGLWVAAKLTRPLGRSSR